MTGFLLNLGDVKIDMEVQKSRPHWEKDTEEPNSGLVEERLFVPGKHTLLREVVFQGKANQPQIRLQFETDWEDSSEYGPDCNAVQEGPREIPLDEAGKGSSGFWATVKVWNWGVDVRSVSSLHTVESSVLVQSLA